MFTVTTEKECGCFRKSGIENNQKFDNKDGALINPKFALEINNL